MIVIPPLIWQPEILGAEPLIVIAALIFAFSIMQPVPSASL
jgi:hypothetical protein